MKKLLSFDLSFALHLCLLALSTALFMVTFQSPLLGVLGFESANLFVGLLGPFFCLAAAMNVKWPENAFSKNLFREILWLIIHISFYGGLLAVNGHYKSSCSEGIGLLPFLVVAIPPLLLSLCIGVLLSALFLWRIIKLAMVVAIFALYTGFIASSWWDEPSFRLLTHLSIVMSSDLLAGNSLNVGVIGFRTATLLIALALIVFGNKFLGSSTHKVFSHKTSRPIASLLLIMVIIASAFLLHHYSLKSLGPDHNTLAHDYTLLAHKNDLRIFAHPQKVSIVQAQSMLDEALLFQERIKARLGVITNKPISIWLHASSSDKALYTGANNVHFALPKHREIHISEYDTPHPVLGHELAHIYVGEYTDTLLGTPGMYIWPNLALTEGLAMVLSKELTLDEGFTLQEQAQALYHLEIRPDIDQLFRSSVYFALFHPRASYIYAGAFLQFALDTWPEKERPQKIQMLIRTSSLHALFASKEHYQTTIRQFEQSLNQDLSVSALLWARNNFVHGSIILEDCHQKNVPDRQRLAIALLNKDLPALIQALKLFTKQEQAKLLDTFIHQAQNNGDNEFALTLLQHKESLALNKTPIGIVDTALTKIDMLINLGDVAKALIVLQSLDISSFSAQDQRMLLAKEIFLKSQDRGRLNDAALHFLTAISKNVSLRQLEFAHAAGMYENQLTTSVNVLAAYLYARVLMRFGLHQNALPRIIALLNHKELMPDLFAHELLMMLANTHYQLNHFHEAETLYQSLLKTATSSGERLFIEDQIGRVRYKQLK